MRPLILILALILLAGCTGKSGIPIVGPVVDLGVSTWDSMMDFMSPKVPDVGPPGEMGPEIDPELLAARERDRERARFHQARLWRLAPVVSAASLFFLGAFIRMLFSKGKKGWRILGAGAGLLILGGLFGGLLENQYLTWIFASLVLLGGMGVGVYYVWRKWKCSHHVSDPNSGPSSSASSGAPSQPSPSSTDGSPTP